MGERFSLFQKGGTNTKREKVKLCDDRVKLKVLVLTHVTHIQTHTHTQTFKLCSTETA